MKKSFLFIFYIIFSLFFFGNTVNSQNKSTYPANIRSYFHGVVFPDGVFSLGDSCSIVNPERHDFYTHANGYTQFTDSVRFVIKVSPGSIGHSYPWQYNKVCIGWTGTGNIPSTTYEVVMYDSTLTGPGNLLYVGPTRTATSLPNFPVMGWYSSPDTLPLVNFGARYVGIRFRNSLAQAKYISADESPSTPIWPGYVATNTSGTPVWQTIQSISGFQNYKGLAIRLEGFPGAAPYPLCEGFNSTTFPPTGWTITGTGAAYWIRASVSGFGLGTGSAEYDMWNAGAGLDGHLITLQFQPSYLGDSLKFDIAYCPYFTAQDSLVILTSTDNGTTYTSLARLGPNQMTTSYSCNNNQFTPGAGDWGKKAYLLPIGTNKIDFLGRSQFGNDLYIDSICNYSPERGIGFNNHEVPNVYLLFQNYPNPFNPSTIISYALPKAGNVELKVYDVLGREVAVLVNEYKQVGNYNVEFKADNFASGVYFYKMEAGNFTETKKMSLIK